MKKLLLLLLLCPFMAIAGYLPGTITFNDGSSKFGLLEVPKRHDKQEISFKTDKKAKDVKFSINDVKQFVFTAEDNTEVTFITLRLANPKAFSGKYKIEEEKSWVRLEWDGEVKILIAFVNGAVYYIQKPNEDYARYLAVFYGGFTFGEFNVMKKMVGFIFKEDCPNLEDSLKKEDFKAKGVNLVGIMYEQVCDKQE